MPIYGFRCEQCDREKEQWLPIWDRDKREVLCPSCQERMKRKVEGGNFQLKGTCWSKDGYTTHLGDDPKWKTGTWRNTNES